MSVSQVNHTVRRFDSIDGYLRHVTKAHNPKGESCVSDPDWAGTASFDAAINLCRHGWNTVRPQVEAQLEPLREKLADVLDTAIIRIHDIVGGEPDIDRYLAGELECMWDDFHVEAPHNGKVFTVLISDAVNSTVDGPTLLRRGAAILALVEAFQILGYDLEIWMETSTHQTDTAVSALVRIHAAGEPLDINTIMFPLANPSWLRRFFFATCEGEPQPTRQALGVFPDGFGYGAAADLLCADMIPNLSFTLTKGGSTFDKRIDTDPVAWVLDTLKAQGVYTPVEGVE